MAEQDSTPILPPSAGTRIEDLLREFVSRADELLLTQERMNGLLAAVVSLTEDLSLEAVLERVVQSACTLLHARYGALGVLGGDGGLSHFVTVGMDENLIRRIGHPPRGHGVLGLLIKEPHPLRLSDLRQHPESYGFPANHPPMHSFLGVPIRVRDEVFGNLYLTEKTGDGDFTPEDEDLAVALAAAAGTAIENARLFDDARRRQQWLQACMDISGELIGSPDAAESEGLERIVARARWESGAALALIALPDDGGAGLRCAAAAGETAQEHLGRTIPRSAELAVVLETGEAAVGNDGGRTLGLKAAAALGPVLVAPLGQSAEERGVLILAKPRGSAAFSPTEAEMSAVYCSYAALALELARTGRLREQLVIFSDRERIARDLHDIVIQRLFAAGLSMQSLRRFTDDAVALHRISTVTEELDETIRELRDTIYSLRSVPQGKTKLSASMLRAVQDVSRPLGFAPRLQFDGQLDEVPETVGEHLLAVVSEGLSNAVRHSGAAEITIAVTVAEGRVEILIADDGVGFADPERRSGLANMERRAALAGGVFDVQSAPGAGARISWSAPITG